MPRVLLSYSHDSVEHTQRVRALADQLRADGIEVWIDQYVHDPEEGWIQWMRDQVEQADKVLLVFTETYQRRFESSEGQAESLGSTSEGAIVTQWLYESGGRNAKFRPVVFREEDERFIPLELRRFNPFRVDTPERYDTLLRWLCGVSGLVAPEEHDVDPDATQAGIPPSATRTVASPESPKQEDQSRLYLGDPTGRTDTASTASSSDLGLRPSIPSLREEIQKAHECLIHTRRQDEELRDLFVDTKKSFIKLQQLESYIEVINGRLYRLEHKAFPASPSSNPKSREVTTAWLIASVICAISEFIGCRALPQTWCAFLFGCQIIFLALAFYSLWMLPDTRIRMALPSWGLRRQSSEAATVDEAKLRYIDQASSIMSALEVINTIGDFDYLDEQRSD